MNKIQRKFDGSVPIFFTPHWVFLAHQLGIDELGELDSEGRRVIVQLDNTFRSVSRPAFADVEGVEVVKVGFHTFGIVFRRTSFLETEVCEHLFVGC